ncbi:unnamed protein product [Rotaria socialis]|uniref:Endonuclease/exonuclease/phosphatase domain-containing protein n=1 Tax=Rotaria socialis TaxID=392032 RepID=A0A820ZD55_9BILA|nr:unnamed protein product [Rotaria socialis]
MCKNEPKCAQCDGNHHSLDNQCQVIKEYKDQLKEDVEDAIQKGLLQRLSLQEKSPMFEFRDQDFPPLTTSDNHSNKRWNIALPHTTVESNFLRSSDTEKAFESINDNLTKLIDSNKRLENKIDLLSTSTKTVTLDTQLHQAVLADIINIMKDFVQYFIPATLTSGKSERISLVPVANEYYSRFHFGSSRLINGFQLNHQVQLIPTSHNNNIIKTDQHRTLSRTSNLDVLAKAFFPALHNYLLNPRDEAMHRLKTWNFSTKDQKLVLSLLDEWYSGRTLNTVLEEWEQVGIASLRNQKEYIKILCYNVEGWGTRAVEAIDLAHEVQVSVCIFTEVGELWSTCRLPHFNKFYQKDTNKNGGVCIAVGKHLKATRIEVNIPNTVIIDITGLLEPVRIIGIYWPTSQQRDLDEIQPFVIEGTILSGDFNGTVKEWNSQITDRRGASVREWINENNLNYITSTTNTSKRSLRNIDLSFSNMSTISSETLCSGTSDHWPILLSCENISFDTNVFFPHTNWKIFEAVLALLQIFWMEEQKKNSADEWHWAETNRLVPPEQYGFRPKCLLPTRVLSIYQEVKNNMAANIPTLALYVDYQKAYDRVWHAALLCKLEKNEYASQLIKND